MCRESRLQVSLPSHRNPTKKHKTEPFPKNAASSTTAETSRVIGLPNNANSNLHAIGAYHHSHPQSAMLRSKTGSIASYSSSKPESRRDEPLRTLSAVRKQVANEVALRAILKSQTSAGAKIGVMFLYSQDNEDSYLRLVSDCLADHVLLTNYCFALVSTDNSIGSPAAPLIIRASSEEYITRASLLASSKFIGRIDSTFFQEKYWFARVRGIGKHTLYDEEALWDVVKKCVQPPIEPLLPPPGSQGIDEILDKARAKLQRLTPLEAQRELREELVDAPTFLVDIRPAEQRSRDGGIPGSLTIERTALEWSFDPRCKQRLPIVDRYDLRIIVFCQDGTASSLAALSLQQLGLLNSTDIIGGYIAWREAGLAIDGVPKRSISSLAGELV